MYNYGRKQYFYKICSFLLHKIFLSRLAYIFLCEKSKYIETDFQKWDILCKGEYLEELSTTFPDFSINFSRNLIEKITVGRGMKI